MGIFLPLLLTPFCLLIAAFITIYIIRPLAQLSYYRRKGYPTYFFPLIGIFKKNFDDLKEKNDLLASNKTFYKDNKGKKAGVTNLGSRLCVQLHDIEYIKEYILKQQYYKKAMFMDFFQPLTGLGLANADGERWKRSRRIISAFFNYTFLRDSLPLIQDTTREFLDKIRPEELENFNIVNRIQEITGEIVARMFFGKNLSQASFKGQPITLALAELIKNFGDASRGLLPLLAGTAVFKVPFLRRFKALLKDAKEFRELVNTFIQVRKVEKGVEYNDLLSGLLKAQENGDNEMLFSDEDIINEYVTFVIAGMDTTGHLISMILYNLAKNERYLEGLKKEREEFFEKENHANTDDLQKMDLLHAIIKETLRLHTPVPGVVFREATADHKILDLEIKKGSFVDANIFANHFKEEYFKDAYKFEAERWMDQDMKIPSYAFIPFSAGQRNCIGQHLAQIETKVIVSEFLKRFDFKIKDNYQLKMTINLMYEPMDELLFDLKKI